MTDLTLEQIARALGGEVSGNQVRAPGPGHSPEDRSLCVRLGTNGGFVVFSHAGADTFHCKDYVRERLGLPPFKTVSTGFKNSTETASARSGNGKPNSRTVLARYDYTDETGQLLFQVVRYAPKDFRQRRPNDNGDWSWKLDGVRRVLYRLPALIEASGQDRPIFICEGEKAVDALVKLGIPATCSPMGAGKWRDGYSQPLAGAKVVILPDNDEPGRKHAEHVARSLHGVAASVRVLPLPRLPEGGDVYDWIQAGGSAKQLWQLVENASSAGTTLVYRCASEIELEPIVWLWRSRIAKGKHTCLAGDPGTGKSQLAIAVIAAITTGGEWPCGEGRAPLGSVIILSAEDGAGDTILPRLHAAGADCGRVYIVDAVREENGGERTFNLKSDLATLEKMIAERGDIALVNIDTVNSYLGKTDCHKNAEVRQVLDPLSKMAERMRVAVLSVTHFSKGGNNSSTKALHRFLGSIGFVGSPRAAFATFEDPDDPERRLFLHAKNNLAAPPQGLAYRLEQTIIGEPRQGIVASRVKWEPEPVAMTANEAMAADAATSDKGFPREEAKDFLWQMLADAPADVETVNKEAKSLGIAERTLKRARADLGVKATKGDFKGGWSLSLPQEGHLPPKGAT